MNEGFEGAQRCSAELAAPALIWGAIGAGARATALRVLVWKTACDSIFQEDAALTDARTLAALEAELPAEASVIPVRANELLGQALAEAEKDGRRTLVVSARGGQTAITDASVAVDGRPSSCKTQCSLDVRPGDHWIRVERDGFSPSARLVRVETSRAPQSVVFDLAVAQGGNVEGSVPDQVVEIHGVKVMGWSNTPAHLAADASALFARNLYNFLSAFWDKDAGRPVLDEEIGNAVRLTLGGKVVHERLLG